MDVGILAVIVTCLGIISTTFFNSKIKGHNNHEENNERTKEKIEEIDARNRLDKNITEMRTEMSVKMESIDSNMKDLVAESKSQNSRITKLEHETLKQGMMLADVKDSAKSANERLDYMNAPSVWESRRNMLRTEDNTEKPVSH